MKLKLLEWVVSGLLFASLAGVFATLMQPWVDRTFRGNYVESYGGNVVKGEHHDYELEVKSNSLVTLDLKRVTSGEGTYTIQLIRPGSYSPEPIGLDPNQNCAPSPTSVHFCSSGYGGVDHLFSDFIEAAGVYVLRITGRTAGSRYTVYATVSQKTGRMP